VCENKWGDVWKRRTQLYTHGETQEEKKFLGEKPIKGEREGVL